MSFAWFVARRYLTARRRQAFISLISAVSVVGVGVGVMALVIALALMTGVQGELRDRLVGSAAHVYVQKTRVPFADMATERQRLERPGIVAMAPAVMGWGLIDTGGVAQPAQIVGIDPEAEKAVTRIEAAMVSGSLDALTGREGRRGGIVLGTDLARQLGLQVGDLVQVRSTAVTSTPLGLAPRSPYFEVVGTFQFGVFQIDNGQAFVSLERGERLFDTEGPDTIQLRLADMNTAPAVTDALQRELGPDYIVRDWTDLNGDLYAALWLEKMAISLTIGLIVMVAALNIVASLVLLVMEKTRDVAILRTMGAPAAVIRRIFMFQGLAIGLAGTITGTVLGLIVSFVADRYRLVKMPADVYQISYLPFRVEPLDVAIVVVAAVLVCFIATLYPSRQAGRIDPAEALRNQ